MKATKHKPAKKVVWLEEHEKIQKDLGERK